MKRVLAKASAVAIPLCLMAAGAGADPTMLQLKAKPQANRVIKAIKRKPFVSDALLKAIALPDMSGWTPITNGAAKSGAAVVRTGRTLVITRGGDDNLYVADLNTKALGPIDAGSWQMLPVAERARSEPDCKAGAYPADSGKSGYAVVCGYLGPDGGANYMAFADTGSGDLQYLNDKNLGGHDAGAAPTIMSAQTYMNQKYGLATGLYMMVWDGGQSLFVKEDGWAHNDPQGDSSAFGAPWAKLATPVAQPPGCGNACFVSDHKRVSWVMLSGKTVDINTVATPSPELDAGISGKPAVVDVGGANLVVVVRGNNGRIYQIEYSMFTKAFGKWRDQGGFATAGATPGCVANGTQPVCVIRGPDGRLYAKALASTAGL